MPGGLSDPSALLKFRLGVIEASGTQPVPIKPTTSLLTHGLPQYSHLTVTSQSLEADAGLTLPTPPSAITLLSGAAV